VIKKKFGKLKSNNIIKCRTTSYYILEFLIFKKYHNSYDMVKFHTWEGAVFRLLNLYFKI